MTETLLTSASVYRNGCIEKRTGTVYLKQGTQEIRLRGLSNSADGDSLRLSVPQGVSGSNVQLSHLSQEEKQEKLKEYSDRLDRITSLIETKEKLAALWENNADFSQKESISIGEMTSYLEKLPERLEAISRELTRLREEKKTLDKEYAEAKNKAALPYVTAELYAAKAGEYPVELTYRDFQASWNPVYEIHSDKDSDSLKLRMRAQIMQNTHEDWEGATLTLFSGNPSVSGTIPEMNPTHLRFYVPRPKARTAGFGGMMKASAMREAKMVMEEECLDADATMEMSAAPMMNMVAADSGRAVKGETMTEYPLNGTWDIRKGQEIICDIKTDLLSCRCHVVAVPKLSDEAYLAAEVATADLEDMQDTPAAVYVNGAFVGNVVLKLTEGVSLTIFKLVKKAITENLKSKIGGVFIRSQLMKLKNDFDYEEYGGAPVLGVNGPVMKMHGSSSATAVKNAIIRGIPYAKEDVVGIIRDEMLELEVIEEE